MLSASRAGAQDDASASGSLSFLQRRVREEAEAAVRASSMPATLIHVALATAYAKRIGEISNRETASAEQKWADDNRVW